MVGLISKAPKILSSARKMFFGSKLKTGLTVNGGLMASSQGNRNGIISKTRKDTW